MANLSEPNPGEVDPQPSPPQPSPPVPSPPVVDSRAEPGPASLHEADSRDAINRDALVARALAADPVTAPQRFRDLEPGKVHNPSAMLRRRNLIIRVLSHLMFRKVAFDERHQATIRQAGVEGDVVFAMNHHSLLDYLYFNYAFLRFGLPLVYFANHISLTAFRPLWQLVYAGCRRLLGRKNKRLQDTELLAYGVERQRPALLFLKRRALWPWSMTEDDSADPYLHGLLALQKERIAACQEGQIPRPIRVIPQLLVWTQEPQRYDRSLTSLVFGNPAAPSRMRKLINFLVNRRRAFVQTAEPVDLAAFIAEQPADVDDATLTSSLRHQIVKAVRAEERVIKGPVLKSAKRIGEEILKTSEVERQVRELGAQQGKSRDAIEKEIRGYLKEIAADFSISYIEMLCMLFTVVFDRIYSELIADLEGLEKVREAARKGPLILLPCHRSHVDYLVLSYIFYANGLVPPHIAAGKNLAFWPLGHIFRRCGAFFLRRSFKDNPAYALAFKEYLRKLIKDGYGIEFFIEGGRSRTGKMLTPRFGMLRTVLDAVRADEHRDVYLAPVYIGYEQIIEERAYTEEIGGAEKKRENITALLKTTKVLWSRYGRLYVNFAEPLSCRELLADEGVLETEPSEDEDTTFVRRAAYKVLDGINSVAMLTPSAVTAMALLMNRGRGVSRRVLLARCGFILEVAGFAKAPLSKTLEHALRLRRADVAEAVGEFKKTLPRAASVGLGERSPIAIARGEVVAEAIDEAVGRFLKQKHIEVHRYEEDDETIYVTVPDKRFNLDMYKNNIIHLFVVDAMVAAAVRGGRRRGQHTVRDLRATAHVLATTLKLEFVYEPGMTYDESFDAALARLEERALLRLLPPDGPPKLSVAGQESADVEGSPSPQVPAPAARVEVLAEDTLATYHRVIEPFLEAYWLTVHGVREQLTAPMPEKEFIKQLQRLGRRLFQEGAIACPEAASSVAFKNALQILVERGYIERNRKGRDTWVGLAAGAVEDASGLGAFEERLRGLFDT